MSKQAAFTVLNTFADSRVALIKGMKDAGYKTLEACDPIVREWAALKTGCAFKEAASSGKIMLDSKDANYEAAKSVVRDIMAMLEGTTRHAKAKAASSGHSKPTKTRVSAEERAAFEALVAACGGDKARAIVVAKALA